jgi:hypothetical protein
MISHLPSDNQTSGKCMLPDGSIFYPLETRRNLAPAGSGRHALPTSRAESPSIYRDNRAIHFRFQDGANWWTPSGVAAKRKQIENKGLPCMKGWRFITLTIDQKLFPDPLTA